MENREDEAVRRYGELSGVIPEMKRLFLMKRSMNCRSSP
jgi:hypothetical protein